MPIKCFHDFFRTEEKDKIVRDLELPAVYDSDNASPLFGKIRIAYLPKL